MKSPVPWRVPPDGVAEDEERTASGIYGLIVSAGVMAAAHEPTSGQLAVAVLVTLVVYWAAERYATIIAGRIVAGRKRTAAEMRRELSRGWGLVTASFLPLAVLVTVDLFGGDLRDAVLTALIFSTVLLVLASLRMGVDGRLTVVERLASACAAGVLGVVLIALKVSLH
jgi:hypothetical protein